MSQQEALKSLPIVLHAMTTPYFRNRMINRHLLEDLAFFTSQVEELPFIAQDEFKTALLLILEVVSQVHNCTAMTILMVTESLNSDIAP